MVTLLTLTDRGRRERKADKVYLKKIISIVDEEGEFNARNVSKSPANTFISLWFISTIVN